MDTIVKKQMLEFLEPGSSIPLEVLLEEFAKLANGTKRANFHITRNVKTEKWRVHLGGIGKSFVGDDLRKLIIEAGEFVFTNSIQSKTERILKHILP